jgi:hypothetical protein
LKELGYNLKQIEKLRKDGVCAGTETK